MPESVTTLELVAFGGAVLAALIAIGFLFRVFLRSAAADGGCGDDLEDATRRG
jgi:hypothetical protein